MGEQHQLTRMWHGGWVCIASVPKLLAWQVPVTLVFVREAWMITRFAGRLVLLMAGGTVVWLTVQTDQWWWLERFHSDSGVGRCFVFHTIATVVHPVLLPALTMCLVRRSVPLLRSYTDDGVASQHSEDFRNVSVTHVDTAA